MNPGCNDFQVGLSMEYCGLVCHPLVGLLLSFIFVCVNVNTGYVFV